MNDKKTTLITIGVIVIYLCVLFGWHFYDPSSGFTESHPGADQRPEGHARKADDVLIGEFFMQDSSTQVQPVLKGEWPCFRGMQHDNQVTSSSKMALVEGAFKELWSVETGEGHAAPVISEGRVYVLDYDEQLSSDALRCFDLLTGRQLWRRWYRVPMKRNHGFSRTIPAICDGLRFSDVEDCAYIQKDEGSSRRSSCCSCTLCNPHGLLWNISGLCLPDRDSNRNIHHI